jgi:hypothetical protein
MGSKSLTRLHVRSGTAQNRRVSKVAHWRLILGFIILQSSSRLRIQSPWMPRIRKSVFCMYANSKRMRLSPVCEVDDLFRLICRTPAVPLGGKMVSESGSIIEIRWPRPQERDTPNPKSILIYRTSPRYSSSYVEKRRRTAHAQVCQNLGSRIMHPSKSRTIRHFPDEDHKLQSN